MSKKVLVGMSGGVDSSAAALLLKNGGYEVWGCTMRLYDNSVLGGSFPESGCCSLDDVSDAKSVCRKIGIEHITLNFTDEFGKHVMRPFAESYINGETPNPCILCNRHMKFGLMLQRARLLGFDFIATGHYADIGRSDGKYTLLRPSDRRKDQTYVLYGMDQDQLAHTLFPLYGMEKSEIRRLAEENGLVNARKKDSQDICFVPDGDHAAFIERYTGYAPQKGDFISESGEIMGRHGGIIRFTVGQRRGLGIAAGRPVYVTAKNPADNTVTLSERELEKKEIFLREVNIISGVPLTAPTRAQVKIRYGAREQDAVVYPENEKRLTRVVFEETAKNPAPGQACVFYSGDVVLGGGIITQGEA
ncbi:MAG: tRNA 2-thiouridine(34) synthase MnmA [Ruminococcus sp.]|nr:tRNA 2-thiouridine(34) synthase MnmA [Ruminococcus sp.]